jgi:hypothetical protein
MKRRYVVVIIAILLGAGYYFAGQFSDWRGKPRASDPQQEQADSVRNLLRR